MNRRSILLAAALAVELLALCGIAGLGDLRAHVVPFLVLFFTAFGALMVAARQLRERPVSFTTIALIALVLRLPFFFTQPSLSDDVWRYLHDGRAQLAGVSPYSFAPMDARTAEFRAPEHALINHPHVVTIYPPGAQLAFLVNGLLGSSLLGWRLLLIVCELLLLAMLARLGAQPGNLVLYGWHPLAVLEVVGNAHLDPIGIALLVAGLLAAAQRRGVTAGVLIGLSAAFKFIAAPVLLASGYVRNPRVVAAAPVAVISLYALYWSGGPAFGSLPLFATSWEANASIYAVLTWLTDGHRARILAATLLVCVMIILHRSERPELERAAMLICALLLLSPVTQPWYLLWLLAFVPVIGKGWLRTTVLIWSGTVVLAYAGAIVVEYVPVYAALTAAAHARFRSRASSP